VFDISATKQLILQNDNTPTIHNTAIKQLDRFRFMVLIHSIRDIPQTVDMGRHYYLEYTMCE
jgi:LMBR1 domain-containing protein 1